MITFSKVAESTLKGGKRVLKVLQFGVKTADESAPFGVDSSPIKDMTAIYADTSNNSESVIIGYISKNQLAEAGETRFYSLDSNGGLKAFVWLKTNGDIELNGNAYSSVRHEPLNSSLTQVKVDINVELAKIAAAISGLGGVYTVAPINLDLTSSKNDTVKLS
jgi:hypothetical protein